MRRVPCPVVTAKFRAMDRDTVAHWMTQRVLTIAPQEKLTAACALMQQHRIRSIPVMDNGKVVGIISDRDISAHLSNLDSLDVAQVITAKLITTTPQTSIRDAARLLCELKVGAMLVIEEERLAGIISTSDLLEALVDLR